MTGANGDAQIFAIIWIILFVIFLCFPCVWTKGRRRTCWRRLQQCTWDVEVVPDPPGHSAVDRSNSAGGLRSMENGQAHFSYAEKEEMRQIHLLEKFHNYTTTLKASDIQHRPVEKNNKTNDTINSLEEGKLRSMTSDTISSEQDINDTQSQQKLEEIMEEADKIVCVPCAGQKLNPADEEKESRTVPGLCAICLCEFEARDRVSWSSNSVCPHVFHEECILNWFLQLGRRKKRRNNEEPAPETLEQVYNFPKLCPCCRQDFISVPESADEAAEPQL